MINIENSHKICNVSAVPKQTWFIFLQDYKDLSFVYYRANNLEYYVLESNGKLSLIGKNVGEDGDEVMLLEFKSITFNQK